MGVQQGRYAVAAKGQGTQLTTREHQILQYLMQNRNSPVNTRRLTEHALGLPYNTSSRQVEALVFQLRKKMGHAVIKDRPGYGYLIAEQGMLV